MTLKERYDALCDDYAKALMEKWGEEDHGHWFNKSGGLWVVRAKGLVIPFYEIKVIIDLDISYEEYMEWTEYNNLGTELNMKNVHLEDYRKVRDSISIDDLRGLVAKKHELKEAINEGV